MDRRQDPSSLVAEHGAGPLRVLLVDDDAEEFVLLKHLLCDNVESPVRLSWAPTCDAALRMLEANTYDVALVDYGLGGRTGLELLADPRVKQADVPVVMLTGRADPQLTYASLSAGAVDYLAKKDVTLTVLTRCLRYAVERHRVHKEAEAHRAHVAAMEQQLLHAHKMEAIGKLAGGIAHDFNNLLTAILGLGELVSERLDPDSVEYEDMRSVLAAGESAARLTRQLLAFSRKQILEPQVLDLNTLVREMQGLLTRVVGEQIRFETSLSDTVRPVHADRGQLEQIIVNLVVNAIDAMPQGGTLRIGTVLEEIGEDFCARYTGVQPGPHVVLSVSDTGVGMSDDLRRQIFEPFFTTKERGGGSGTGLGLATVYGIVEQSGGCIDVASTPGEGSTFRIFLPVTTRSEESLTTRAPAGSEPVARPRGIERILVVEDQWEVREAVREMLERHGYEVLVAPDGPAAIEIAEGHPERIELLLTDVVMPRMNGRELAERITARNVMPVLFMSGYAEDAIVRQALQDPGFELLRKPFKPDQLLTRVRDLLDRRAMA